MTMIDEVLESMINEAAENLAASIFRDQILTGFDRQHHRYRSDVKALDIRSLLCSSLFLAFPPPVWTTDALSEMDQHYFQGAPPHSPARLLFTRQSAADTA